MVSTKKLKDKSKHWHEQHVKWLSEVETWEHETQRLVALLYMLEKNLPEHSRMLNDHVFLIKEYEKRTKCFTCEQEGERCFTDCPEFMTPDQGREFREKLSQLHANVKQEHKKLRRMYVDEMDVFKRLAKKLLDESQLPQ